MGLIKPRKSSIFNFSDWCVMCTVNVISCSFDENIHDEKEKSEGSCKKDNESK